MLKRRIKRITIKNYRSITDLTLEMPDLMVLVGENGSGKSNFVDALRFLSDAMRYGLQVAIDRRGGIVSIRSSYRKDLEVGITIEFEFEDILYKYEFMIDVKPNYGYYVKKEDFQKNNQPILNELPLV